MGNWQIPEKVKLNLCLFEVKMVVRSASSNGSSYILASSYS